MKTEKEAFSPSRANMKLVHEVSASISPQEDSMRNWYENYSQNHGERIAFDLEIVRSYAHLNDKILEFGSIPLLLTVALKERGFTVTGLDVNPDRFFSTIKKWALDIRKCNFETEPLPFNDAAFDMIIFNELFEHLRINPLFTMREAFRVLKPGGKLLLSTPNLRSLKGVWNLMVHNISNSCSGDLHFEYQKLEKLGHMGHVREYTSTEISNFLEKIGFKISKILWRGKYHGLARLVIRIIPSFRPYLSVIAIKPE